METDVLILKSQYQRLLDRYKGEAMADARQKKKEDDIDIQKIIAEITTNPNISIQKIIAEISTNPNTSIQKIIAENPKIIEQILKRI